MTAETLSGIPSIIYGLFGLLFFATYLHWGYSMWWGIDLSYYDLATCYSYD